MQSLKNGLQPHVLSEFIVLNENSITSIIAASILTIGVKFCINFEDGMGLVLVWVAQVDIFVLVVEASLNCLLLSV